MDQTCTKPKLLRNILPHGFGFYAQILYIAMGLHVTSWIKLSHLWIFFMIWSSRLGSIACIFSCFRKWAHGPMLLFASPSGPHDSQNSCSVMRAQGPYFLLFTRVGPHNDSLYIHKINHCVGNAHCQIICKLFGFIGLQVHKAHQHSCKFKLFTGQIMQNSLIG